MGEISSFGYWIRRRRKALDLTQTDLARLVFCSLSTIKKIELDERRPSQLMAERLAECLQISGTDRKTFLAVASAEVVFDRFQPTTEPFTPAIAGSNIRSYQPSTPFVGYEHELVELNELIINQKSRLITLVGPGGIGKTRLAIQVAVGLIDRYPGGVYFVSLTQLENPDYIHSAILDTIFRSHHSVPDPRAYLLEYLQDRTILLVLDNFEHLLDGAEIVADILAACPSVAVLITSRVPLHLSNERVFEVKGLQVDRVDSQDKQASSAAVQLFTNTAKRVGSEEKLTKDNLATIIRICNLVEGMPLAIEIAASWSRLRSFSQIESGIKNNLEFLTSTMRDSTERHRSVLAAFEYSWKTLSDEEKQVFSVLSIFHGGFTLPAICAIAETDQDTIDSLVNKSLVIHTESDRYDIHELVRRFSELKLGGPEKLRQYREIHLSYFGELAGKIYPGQKPERADDIFRLLDKDIDNFRAALMTAVEFQAIERGLCLVIDLNPLWHSNGYLQEGRLWLTRMLDQENGQYPHLRAKAVLQACKIAQELGDFEQAILLGKECLTLFKVIRDKAGIGYTLRIMGTARYLNGEFERGIKLLNRSLSIFEEIGNEEAQAESLIRIADVNMRRGLLDLAGDQFERALLISTRINNNYEMGFSMGGLGDIYRLQGKYVEAFELYKKSLIIHWEGNHRLDLPFVLEAIALEFASLGYFDKSAYLWGAADNLREEIHSPLPPSYTKSYAPTIELTRRQLGEAEFFSFWQEGRIASLEEVVTSSIGWSDKQ